MFSHEKTQLGELVRMLVGLRKSWGGVELREDPPGGEAAYSSQASGLLGHERLDAYRTGLDFVRWFHALPGGEALSSRAVKQVDKSATSMVLNIAESNGRFSEDDRRRFIDIAEGAAVKAAAWVDLCQRAEFLDCAGARRGIDLLDRVAQMLVGLAAR